MTNKLTATAAEIMKRFQSSKFQPITITMKKNNETLELHAKKIHDTKKWTRYNIIITVLRNDYALAIGGLEPIAAYLRGGDHLYARYSDTVTKDATKIAVNTLLDLATFEPVDTEGNEYEGVAIYKDGTYPVFLSRYGEEDYIMQAAIDISEQI